MGKNKNKTPAVNPQQSNEAASQQPQNLTVEQPQNGGCSRQQQNPTVEQPQTGGCSCQQQNTMVEQPQTGGCSHKQQNMTIEQPQTGGCSRLQQQAPEQSEPAAHPNTSGEQRGKANSPRPDKGKRHRITGAEQKKRQRARQQAEAVASGSNSAALNNTGKPRKGNPVKNKGAQKGGHTGTQQGLGVSPLKRAPLKDPKKRVRSDGSEGHPTPGKRFRSGQNKQIGQPSRSFGEAAARHLKVAVVSQSDLLGRLTQEQAEMVEDALTRELDNFLGNPSASRAIPPTFKGGFTHNGGILRIACSDQSTLDWLTAAVAGLSQLWEEATLKVVPVDRLPRLLKATVWIPGKPESLELVRRRLEGQNPWVAVKKWCLFHHSEQGEPNIGQLLVFGIPVEEAEIIKNKGGRMNYKFTSLKIKIHGEESSAGTETAPVEASKPPKPDPPVPENPSPSEPAATGEMAVGNDNPTEAGPSEVRMAVSSDNRPDTEDDLLATGSEDEG